MIVIHISAQTLQEISDKICRPEQGGIIGADETGAIRFFHFDSGGKSLPNEYVPDTFTLNRILSDWYSSNIAFAGIIHSHPSNKAVLSHADITYAQQICRTCQMDKVLMLLYLPELSDDSSKLIGYVTDIHGQTTKTDLVTIL